MQGVRSLESCQMVGHMVGRIHTWPWPGLASRSPRKQTQSRAGDSWHPALLPSKGQCCPCLLALAAFSGTQTALPHPEIPDASWSVRGLVLCMTDQQATGLVFQHRQSLAPALKGRPALDLSPRLVTSLPIKPPIDTCG